MAQKWIDKVKIEPLNELSKFREIQFKYLIEGKDPPYEVYEELFPNQTHLQKKFSPTSFNKLTGPDGKIILCAEKIAELQTENKQLREEVAELKKAFTDLLDAMLHSKQSES